MTLFRLPIGDWSDDGHGKCEYFIVESNKPFAAVNKAWKAAKKLKSLKGIDFKKICADADENQIEEDIWELLKKAGFKTTSKDMALFEKNERMPETSFFADLIIWYLMKGDPDLQLKRMPDSTVPLFHPDGHLGYGLFW